MKKYPLSDIGDTITGTEFRRGIIVSLNLKTDKADIEVNGQKYSSVPVFYKCTGTEEATSEGAVSGAAQSFVEGDEVTVCFIRGVPLVVGFTGGARPCYRNRLAYRAEGGWFVAEEGKIKPSVFITDAEFEMQYSQVQPLDSGGIYSHSADKVQIDSCVTAVDHSILFKGVSVSHARVFYDLCWAKRWGEWLSLSEQSLFADFGICFYSLDEAVIVDGDRWTLTHSYRLGFGSEYTEICAQKEAWYVYPIYSGEKVRRVNPFYGGRGKDGSFVLASCVIGTQTEDTALHVFIYDSNGLKTLVFPIADGLADLGMGSADVSAFLVREKKGGGNGLEKS